MCVHTHIHTYSFVFMKTGSDFISNPLFSHIHLSFSNSVHINMRAAIRKFKISKKNYWMSPKKKKKVCTICSRVF